ncbi:MAG TPA: ADP-forming succinate--CoA ligase subunit beta [Fimbriimonadaceae bacterium]|jgi:succinyl-CoA synthetase beta subunit
MVTFFLRMKLHEYQSKELLTRFNVPVAKGDIATDGKHATEIAKSLGGKVVVKAQVLMGGRGKAGGVKLFDNAEDAGKFAGELIGKKLVSIQNPAGMIVEKVLVAEQVDIAKEFYVAVLLDRATQRDMVMLSAKGGMEIEEVAVSDPKAIVQIQIDPAYGLCDFEIRRALKDAEIPKEARGQMVGIIKNLVKAYEDSDADMVEINPLAMTPQGKIIAADAKVSIDDNAVYRHADYVATKEDSAEDPIEAEASRRGIAYVRLGGDIGIIGNGAGLVMSSLDEVSSAGGRPADFLDVGGGAQAERVKSCVELIMMDAEVKGLLLNIFGGITRCDEVAKGVLQALDELNVQIPVVARIEGTAAEEGRRILQGSRVIAAETMQEAANKIVELAYA